MHEVTSDLPFFSNYTVPNGLPLSSDTAAIKHILTITYFRCLVGCFLVEENPKAEPSKLSASITMVLNSRLSFDLSKMIVAFRN